MAVQCEEYYPEIKGSFSFEIEKVLFSRQSSYQRVEVVQSKGLGRVLLIDGLVMLTERDEFVYHEMIAHTPLFVHPDPRRVLIIGGGDGGTVRECLKHQSVEKVTLVDIDELVTRASLEYLPSVAGAVLSDRVECRFEDGVKFVKGTTERYDIVIIDSTDPISVGEGLFTHAFYQDCFKVLSDDGILVNQSESPAWQAEEVAKISAKLRRVFPRLYFYQAHIPTYPSGHWLFGFASKQYHPMRDFREAYYRQFAHPLRYYNDGLHRGAFALPNFVKELIDAQ